MAGKSGSKGDAAILAMPGTPEEMRQILGRTLGRVGEGDIRLVIVLTIDSRGDAGYEWSGASSAIERVGLLAGMQHDMLRTLTTMGGVEP